MEAMSGYFSGWKSTRARLTGDGVCERTDTGGHCSHGCGLTNWLLITAAQVARRVLF
jgi:hypothetical protein